MYTPAAHHQKNRLEKIFRRTPLHRFHHKPQKTRHKQIRPRAGSGHPQHVALWIAQPAKVDRNRFCPPECVLPLAGNQYQNRNHDRPHRIDVTDRIERNATRLIGRQIAEMSGRVTVRRFMQGNRENTGNRVQRDEADRVIQFHHAGTPNGTALPFPRLTTISRSPVRFTTVVISTPQDPPSSTTSTSCCSRVRISSMSLSGNSSPGSISVELNIGSPISSSNARTTLWSGTRTPMVLRFGFSRRLGTSRLALRMNV